ncbi:hypothetical protein AAG906_026834 [Vitis piasezkii]
MLDETTIKTDAFKVIKRTIGKQSTLGMAEFPGLCRGWRWWLSLWCSAVVMQRCGERRYLGRHAFLMIPRVMGAPLSVKVAAKRFFGEDEDARWRRR